MTRRRSEPTAVRPEWRRWRGFYFITDSRLTVNGILEDVRQALSAGSVMVQYREKEAPLAARREEAARLLQLCRAHSTPFVVNDDVELAAEIGADGVHLGQKDTSLLEARRRLGPSAVIGVSAGSVEEARAAERDGADYVSASPVFATPTKPDAGPPLGLEGLASVRAVTRVPLAAIGGLNAANVRSCVEAGADMICAISASLAGGRVAENIRTLLQAFEPFRGA